MSRIVSPAVKAAAGAALALGFLNSAVADPITPTTQPSTMRPSVLAKRALDRPLPELRFNAAGLSDCIDFLSDATGANIDVDWRALDAAKVEKDTPITLRMNSAISLRKALKMILQDAGGVGTLTFYVDEGVIQVTSQEQEDKELVTRLYPIQDLLFQAPDYTNAPSLDLTNNNSGTAGGGGGGGGGGSGSNLFQNANTQTNANSGTSRQDRANEIIKMITTTVRPEIWKDNGGPATISFFHDNLVVTAPRSVQEMLSSQ